MKGIFYLHYRCQFSEVDSFNPRPDEVWRVTRPDEGVAQRAPLRIFKSKSRRVKIQTALERSRRTLQDTIMLTLFFDL